jgi:putative transposase
VAETLTALRVFHSETGRLMLDRDQNAALKAAVAGRGLVRPNPCGRDVGAAARQAIPEGAGSRHR